MAGLVRLLSVALVLTVVSAGVDKGYRAFYDYDSWAEKKNIDDDIIDLDDVTPDDSKGLSAAKETAKETGEDEERDNSVEDYESESEDESDSDEGSQIELPNIFDIETDSVEESDNVTLIDDDDGDFGSGSGSGDFLDVEEVPIGNTSVTELVVVQQDAENTTEYYSAGDNGLPDDSTEDKDTESSDESETSSGESKSPSETTTVVQEDLPPYCEELTNATWTPWSPWIRSGDSDVRFRRCQSYHGYTSSLNSCEGSYFEVRPCSPRNVRACRTGTGDVTEEYDVICRGIDLRDTNTVDELENPFDSKDNCEFSLYDLQYNLAIGVPLTTDGLLMTADPQMWCFSRDKYLPFYSPTQYCKRTLMTFCKVNTKCKHEKKQRKELKHKGDLKKTCWEDFVLGGVMPEGLSTSGGTQMICQKFDKHGMYGRVLGHKKDYFATMYDTFRRAPVMSMVVVRELGDDKWPELPFLIERGLIPEETGTLTWFFKDKKKGITRLEDVNSGCNSDTCAYGQKQAMTADYDLSGYKIAHLLPPDVIGGDLATRISTFTLTNTAAMLPSVYPQWKRSISLVRKFAKNQCRLPEFGNPTNTTKSEPSRGKHNYPEMYLVSGVVPSIRHEEVIGNDVNVPSLFWLAACCAQGAEVSSFGLYTYNQYGQSAHAVSVQNLQQLLQTSFYDSDLITPIKLFPAFEGICSSPENDLSYKIEL